MRRGAARCLRRAQQPQPTSDLVAERGRRRLRIPRRTDGPRSCGIGAHRPIRASGFVHAGDYGEPRVDITVCASFDQPVRFIEAIFEFSGPVRSSRRSLAMRARPLLAGALLALPAVAAFGV